MSERKRNPRPPYPPEVRERAVRMVFEHQDDYSSQWKAIESIAAKLSINHETLRQWVKTARDRWRSATRAHHRRADSDQRAGKRERRAAPGQ